MKLAHLALTLSLTLGLAACGQEPAGRPTVAELEPALWALADAERTRTQQSVIHCQAVALEASEISDEGLWAFAGDEEYDLSPEEKTLLAEGGPLWQKLKTCQGNV